MKKEQIIKMKYSFKLLKDEYWWGGSTDDGTKMPFSASSSYKADFRRNCPNQGMPLLVSNLGRYIRSDAPFALEFRGDEILIDGENVTLTVAGSTLKDAYLAAMRAHFPFDGSIPHEDFFKTAQYNTWMEFCYDQTQEGVLSYAHAIIENGLKPGIFIIDEGWQVAYGDWSFDRLKFPDPKAMVAELHSLGFVVMLWVVPYVMPCGVKWVKETQAYLNPNGYMKHFIRTEDGSPAILDWWNGLSGLLDFESDDDCEFLDAQLKKLMTDYGIDGFKFDGGTLSDFTGEHIVNGRIKDIDLPEYSAMKKNIAWNNFGTRYPFHEYKDSFGFGGKPTVQRLRDKGHCWDGDGINTFLPNSIAAGILGYPFICPDMIGGGEWTYSDDPNFEIDEELFVRMAQASVFFPMMQFSWAPWRVLSPESFALVKKAADMHAELANELLQIIKASAESGEPVLRSLEYEFPHKGYQNISDEVLCGKDILVCPVVTKGCVERSVTIPEGTWVDELGSVYTEGVYRIETPIDRLPYFRRKY